MKHLLSILLLSTLLLQSLLGIDILRVSGQCTDDQREVLFQLRNTLVFNSSVSTKLISWNVNKDCCIWNGVVCNLSGEVIGLDLNNEGISGGIDDSSILFSFQKLRMLNLAQNAFNYKSISSRFGNLTSLHYLNLSNSNFAGKIPRNFSQLTRLEVLDLSSSYTYGNFSLKVEKPSLAMLVENLQQLTGLYLDYVNMSAHKSDWCQVLSSLTHLKVLSLSGCSLSGPIDESFQKLQSLSIINLSGNNFSTHVPDLFASFTNLTTLHLGACNLNGKFPTKVFQLPMLEVLDLSMNGDLYGSLEDLSKNKLLRTLVLSDTKFSGLIPESIGDLEMLYRLELDGCYFSGRIPLSMENLTHLSYLEMSSNNFTGQIPSFKLCKNLTHIGLSRNSLSGLLPSDSFEGLDNLVSVDLRFNMFHGILPISLFSLPRIQSIELSNNNFGGSLVNISNASTSLLHTLDLSSNKLEGEIPISIFEIQCLNTLILSWNNLRGKILIETFQRLNNITTLDFSYNNMSIEIKSRDSNMPSFPQLHSLKLASCNLRDFPNLRNQSMLFHLDLSNNKIGGEIPSWIWGRANELPFHLNLSHNQLVGFQKPYLFPEYMSVLDLHSNQIGGVIAVPPPSASYIDYSDNRFNSSIPDSIGYNLSYAYFFSISRNSLTGRIPQTICSAFYLEVLDMSHNDLNGMIPRCLFEFEGNRRVLNLGNNSLHGSIETTYTRRCSLSTLDLHGNLLEGKIPRSLSNCKMLEVLNLGNNLIKDTYPCFLKHNSNLRVLILRSNKLYGRAHCNSSMSSTWKQLQIFDIAYNSLAGYVPNDWFWNWHAMMTDQIGLQSSKKQLSIQILSFSGFYYQDTATVTMKGLDLDLVKILTIFTSVDISSNHFEGEIPSVIGRLKALYLLNMSHNEFTGTIPSSFGDLEQIESVDLSTNKLVGEIPAVLAKLPFLSSLKLSYNQLEGRIPLGPQFQTFTDDSYKGNLNLCGYPLTNCIGSKESTSPTPISTGSHHDTTKVKDWLSYELGFVVGLGIFVMPLIVSGRWSTWYHYHVDRIFLKNLYRCYERRNCMRTKNRNRI